MNHFSGPGQLSTLSKPPGNGSSKGPLEPREPWRKPRRGCRATYRAKRARSGCVGGSHRSGLHKACQLSWSNPCVRSFSNWGGAIPKCVDSGFLLSLEANEKKVLMFDTGSLGEFLRIQHLVTVQWIQIMDSDCLPPKSKRLGSTVLMPIGSILMQAAWQNRVKPIARTLAKAWKHTWVSIFREPAPPPKQKIWCSFWLPSKATKTGVLEKRQTHILPLLNKKLEAPN